MYSPWWRLRSNNVVVVVKLLHLCTHLISYNYTTFVMRQTGLPSEIELIDIQPIETCFIGKALHYMCVTNYFETNCILIFLQEGPPELGIF